MKKGYLIILCMLATAFNSVLVAQACPGLASATINIIAPPTPDILGGGDLCTSDATLSLSQPYSTYAWSTGESSSAINVSASGAYTVTVTNSNGCTGTATTDVNFVPDLAPGITASPYACNNQLTLDAEPGFVTYSWSNGQSGPSITVNSSGLYTVTVTNADGCTGTGTFDASIPAPPSVSITGGNTVCAGNTTTLSATGGFSNYAWSNGQSGQTVDVDAAGNYTVTVTDAFGCTATGSQNILLLPSPQPNIAGITQLCEGLNTTFNAGAGFTGYSWSNGASTQTITTGAGGLYSVTVTAANGCTGTDSETFTVLTAPQPNISELPYLCDGELTLATNGPYDVYLWSNGQNTPEITVTVDGNYTLTVTETNGCTGTASYSVLIPGQPFVTITGDNQFCPGSTVSLEASTGFVSYLWTGGLTGNVITVGQAGNYTVTVTDFLGCTGTAVVGVTSLSAPQPSISGPTAICLGSNATFTVNGTFNSYVWSNGENTSSISVNTSGDYTVTVTDVNGCTGSATQSLTVGNVLQAQIVVQPYQCNGQLTLDAGAGFSTYTWSNGQTTQSIAVNQNGTYDVTVSDAGGCSGTASIAASIPPQPIVGVTGDVLVCQGASANLNATTGLNAYVWSDGQIGPDITVTLSGTYTVTATDNNGCTDAASFVVDFSPLPQPQINGPAQICANGNGTLSVTGSFTNYLWTTGETTASINISTAGTFGVTVTDANGCTGTTSQNVTVGTSLQTQITPLPYACDGQITLDAGAGFNTYLWSGGQSTQTISATQSNTYDVTVTDVSGCTGTATTSVTIPVPPAVSISGDNNLCPGETTTLSASTGLTGYLWSDGQTTPTITVNQGGPFGVTATDALGCTASASINVVINTPQTPQISGPTAICNGSSGTLTVAGTYTDYTWSNGELTASISVNSAGSYSVTVSDINGCTATNSQNVTVGAELQIQITPLPYACDGQITLDAGAGFNTYLWSDGQSTQTIPVTQTNTYSVTVSDASGCTGTATTNVTIPVQPAVSISGDNNLCPGETATLSSTAGFANYLWSGGQTSQTIDINQIGSYTVTVTDAVGCTASATFSVIADGLPSPQLSGPSVICEGNSGTLGVVGSYSSYAWSTGETTAAITVSAPGTVFVTVTNDLGCFSVASQTITQIPVSNLQINQITCDPASVGTVQNTYVSQFGCDSVVTIVTTLGPALTVAAEATTNFQGFEVACFGGADGAATATVTGGTAPFTFAWSQGANNGSVFNLPAGQYAVTVTDANGCSGTATVQLESPTPLLSEIYAEDPDCNKEGSLEITSTLGGVSPYSYTLDNQVQTGNGLDVVLFEGLNPGLQTLVVTDANGCLLELEADIEAFVAVQTTFADTFDINSGETIQLVMPVAFDAQNILWTPSTGLSCTDCLNPEVTAVASGLYRVTVEGYSGCEATGTFLIRVKKGGEVYIPNVFTPGSTNNNMFNAFGDDRVVNIRKLQIFDRWGNHIAFIENLTPSDPTQGWDGRYRDEEMQPGVYAYWMEIEYVDGKTEIFSGDVTIVK